MNVSDLNVGATADPREEMRLLIERTQGRESLVALRDVFSRRLHRSSVDFDATRGLRLVSAKLQAISRGLPVVTASS